MDTLQPAKTQQGDFKGHIVPNKCDENEIVRKFQNRQSPSPLQEVSLLQCISPGIVSTPVRTNGLEDIQEEENDLVQSVHHPPPCSSFTFLPSHTTPPPRQSVVQNPFDATLLKRLHLPIYSPTVFKKVVSPSQDMHQFHWTIEDVANIRPAPIEEYNPQQYEPVDPETELKAQEAIDHYFCNTHIASSPWGPQPVSEISPLSQDTESRETASSDSDDGQRGIFVEDTNSVSSTKIEVSVQTMLSLPPQLPVALEAALKPYFTVGQDQNDGEEEVSLSTSSLRRKLFDQDEDQQQMYLSPARSSCFSMQVGSRVNSPANSGLLASSRVFCPSSPIINERTYATPLAGSKYISSPEISPIGNGNHRNKTVSRLNFSTLLMTLEKSSHNPSVSPLGLMPIEHEDDDAAAAQEATQWAQEKKMSLSGISSSMITSETTTPVKGETHGSISAMLTSETTPIKEKYISFANNVSMERTHFHTIADKLKEFGNSNNFIVEEDMSTTNSFCLHSTGEMGIVNLHSQDTGYHTESISCNMTSINGGASSTFGSMSSVSKNWSNIQFKSEDKHDINKCFHGNKNSFPVKGSSIMLEDNSVWLPNSKHIISSTPTKSSS